MSVIILATGDIAPDRDNPSECFAATTDRLKKADIVFGQLETSFADTGTRLPQARHAVMSAPVGAQAVADAGFDVLSFAGNHCLDWGNDALFATINNLTKNGVKVIGVGANIVEARKPAIFETADGTKVAFLAYCSILPMAYWADERRPGCTPMRAHTIYEQIEHDQPGTPPRIHSYPHRDDLAAMEADIKAAKQDADIVIVSHHWGIHFVRAVIADYQRDVAKAAIAAGADAILGHHAHILKGIEFIDGKPVFYSLCNFATDLRMDPAHAASKSFQEIRVLAEEWEPDFESLYNFPKTAALSLVARLEIEDGKLKTSGFHPIHIGRDAIPRFLEPNDPKFGEVVDYMRAVTDEAGLNCSYHIENDIVTIREKAS